MKINAKEFQSDNLVGTQWVALVEDVEDPLFEGRCRVRVLGKLDGREKAEQNIEGQYIIADNFLPWARPSNNLTGCSRSGGGGFSIPKLGSYVKVTFDSGNIYSPIYHEAVGVSDELKEELENSYKNSHSLIYDTSFGIVKKTEGVYVNEREGEGIKVFFTEEKGLVFDYMTTEGSSIINIKNDNSIEITNPNGDQILMENNGSVTINCQNAKVTASEEAHIDSPRIKLGEEAAEAVMKGDTFKQIFDSHIHPTGVGPSGPPTSPSITDSYLSTKNTTD